VPHNKQEPKQKEGASNFSGQSVTRATPTAQEYLVLLLETDQNINSSKTASSNTTRKIELPSVVISSDDPFIDDVAQN
jgi:hypothetical protein